MIVRQFVAIGFICGICASIITLIYRRPDLAMNITNASPLMSISMAIIGLILILAIGLATPIESSEIGVIFDAILLLWGFVLLVFGFFCHLYEPSYLSLAHKTHPQPLFAFKIGILYISLGVQCLIVGFTKNPALALLVQLVLLGWGTSILYLLRAFYGIQDENYNQKKNNYPSNEEEQNVDLNSNSTLNNANFNPFNDREASLRTPEFYLNITIPIIFLTLYIFGDHE